MKKILIIAPHQDDEIIGCGGLICYLKEKKFDIYVCHVFKGNTGIDGISAEECQKIRQEEAFSVANYLGFKLLENLNFDDRGNTSKYELQEKLIYLVRDISPDYLLLPHANETDYEHKLVSIVGRESAWLALTNIKQRNLINNLNLKMQVLYYEVWENISNGKLCLDISKYIKEKENALLLYKSQMGSGWLNGAIGRNAYRGSTLLNHGYCEVFNFEKMNMEEIFNES